jgi:polyisoprenoid-binding protein YceI
MADGIMRNKKWIWLLAAMVSGQLALAGTGDGKGSAPGGGSLTVYSVNPAESILYWKGSKPGGSHHGTVKGVTGRIETRDELIQGGSFQIDMTSIANSDLKDEKMRQRLVEHLKSEDFFYVEEHPVAVFTITGAKQGKEDVQDISGALTLRGISREISFPANISRDGNMIRAQTGEIRLDRTLWGVNHLSKTVFKDLKDQFIDDEMVITLDIQFLRQ